MKDRKRKREGGREKGRKEGCKEKKKEGKERNVIFNRYIYSGVEVEFRQTSWAIPKENF